MPIKNQQKNTGQNRPSEIRLSGVPPIMLTKTKNKQSKNNVKIAHPKYVYQGSPYNAYKTQKNKEN